MRVIAGSHRGRALVAPRGNSVRPTSDRVKEALFSILGSMSGRRILDLFAGSGALGIEALSRGAAHVTFVDESAHTMHDNLDRLELRQRADVRQGKVDRALARLTDETRRFDLVLMDPPYDSELATRALALLGGPCAGLVGPDALVVVEHSRAKAPEPQIGALSCHDCRRYGRTSLSFYARNLAE